MEDNKGVSLDQNDLLPVKVKSKTADYCVWDKAGDHDSVTDITIGSVLTCFFNNEFTVPDTECVICGKKFDKHGFIDNPDGGFLVCPGDVIVTDQNGVTYPMKPDKFNAVFESAV